MMTLSRGDRNYYILDSDEGTSNTGAVCVFVCAAACTSNNNKNLKGKMPMQ